MENAKASLIQQIQSKIYFIRNHRVMLDSDLAELYGVQTKVLNQAVRRNLERFPTDFMFQLSVTEAQFSRSQNVTLKMKRQGTNIKYLPFAFTEQGIAMLSSVLRSDAAIKVNIAIMRAFVKMKAMQSENKAIWDKFDQLEKKYDASFSGVFEAIRQIIAGEPPNQHRKIKAPSE